MMKLSDFGKKLSGDAGIVSLMDDLGAAMSSDRSFMMLGGGNPAHIPEVQQHFRTAMQRILRESDRFEKIIGNYDGPAGDPGFFAALSELFRDQFGWNITPKNMVITNGSQSGFFTLFNMFAGKSPDNLCKKILLPITPEYIGYADVGIQESLFDAHRPTIEDLGDHTFKYRVNFEDIQIDESIGAICVSRPTNPTGNVLTDSEMETLAKLAGSHGVPLIVDDAYGAPFPNIVFSQAKAFWDENTILCLSLSKLGLPGLRTGIIIANEEIAKRLARMAAVMNLAPGSFGPALVTDMVKSGEIIRLSNDVIRPYYQSRAQQAIDWFRQWMGDYPFCIHKTEGAIFLWLWFPQLPITSHELYQRLKARGVLVIAGQHFFPGLKEHWQHRYECIRVTYSQHPTQVEQGLKIIAEEVMRAYDQQKQIA